MNCQRAVAVLRGLEKNELAVEAQEIEDLIALELAVEADPDDMQTLQWLQPVVREHAGCDVDHPNASRCLSMTLQGTEQELKKDWYRMKTSKAVLAAREQDRITMRRALAYLNDHTVVEAMGKLAKNARLLAPGALYVCCEKLGAELYAITQRGWRVRRQLKIRLDRYAEAPFKSFLHAFDKNEAKMRAFSAELTTLTRNVGQVKKNREQLVIGLAKTGLPAAQAISAYQAALRANNAPDVAVTCARNAVAFGNPHNAALRLAEAQAALRHAGFPATPIAMGAAKSLLPFDPPAAGAPRFRELFGRLEQAVGRSEMIFKLTARAMPAAGTPEEIVRRVVAAGALLNQIPNRASPLSREIRSAAVALASMARAEDVLPALVARFREIEYELVHAGVSSPTSAESDALECVTCPGSPIEVVDIVDSLTTQIAIGRRAERADVAVAVAFAKRFAL